MQAYLDDKDAGSYWNDDVELASDGWGRYIAISGNTGVGKSTLVRALAAQLQEEGRKAIALNERVFHHPLLKLMFSLPSDYAFGVQLNFLLQRHLCARRWLSLGYCVIMERCHLDDILYVEDHFARGNISAAELEVYQRLFTVMAEKLPEPDIYFFLRAEPELSLRRLAQAESSGERPREFPTEAVKAQFVRSWAERMNSNFRRMQGLQKARLGFKRSVLVDASAEEPVEILQRELREILDSLE